MPFVLPLQVITRAVPASFDRALQHRVTSIDVARARLQHADYVAALRESGAHVTVLPAEDDLPDSCFVEDPVVVLGQSALLCRSAAPSRAPEGQTLASPLRKHRPLTTMSAPATLDGGDVMRVDDVLYVGRSARSNAHGIQQLRRLAEAEGLSVVPIALEAGLHLKSVVSLAGPDLIVCHHNGPDPRDFRNVDVVMVSEDVGGNVLAMGSHVLVSAAAPNTAEQLARRGCRVRMVAVEEFHKADGALTCLSIRIPPANGWVT